MNRHPLSFSPLAALEDGGDEGGPAARPVFREHQVELVVDAHQLDFGLDIVTYLDIYKLHSLMGTPPVVLLY